SLARANGRRSTPQRVEPPGPRDALQFVFAAVLELDARAHDEILDRRGNQNLAWAAQRRHPGGDMDGEPAEILAANLALSGVEPAPKPDPERPGGLDNLLGAANRPGRTVEGGHEAVPGGVDLLAPETP